MLEQKRKQGFEIITINVEDSKAVVAKYWKQSKFSMRAALKGAEVAQKFRVRATPTNYVVDKNGKIRGAFEGFNESGIRQALTKAGIK